MGALAERLLEPARVLTLPELAEAWFSVRIEALLPGHGALAGDLAMMHMIRGALGRVLERGASAEARARLPCPSDPPCALDVLFRDQARLPGGRSVPKPWVLQTDRRGEDLRVRIVLFGVAGDWAPSVAEALVHGVRWRAIRPEIWRPAPRIADLRVQPRSGVMLGAVPVGAELRLVTPLEAETTDLREVPSAFLGRLARRVERLALWQLASLVEPWETMADHARLLAVETGDLRATTIRRRAGTGAHAFGQPAFEGSIALHGDLGPLCWPRRGRRAGARWLDRAARRSGSAVAIAAPGGNLPRRPRRRAWAGTDRTPKDCVTARVAGPA